jgi:hypothetical protein
MASPDPSSSLWIDAAISGMLGVAAGLVRWLTDPDPKSLGCTARHLLAAGITAGFSGLALANLIDSDGLKYATAGATGYAGVALWDIASAKLRAMLEKFG